MSKLLQLVVYLIVVLGAPTALAQESTFTYQGQLRQGGAPFTGEANLEFRLFDLLAGGSEVATPQTRLNWPIKDGLFQVELDFGTAVFNGTPRYLEIRVLNSNDTDPDAVPVTLNPRQRVTATPYALLAAGTTAGAINGSAVDPAEVQLRVTGACPAGESIRTVNQNGTVVCETDDIGWSLTGNAGTDPATNFIGTTDTVPFEIRTNNTRSFRIIPEGDPARAPSIIAGHPANSAPADTSFGSVIAGGGSTDARNSVSSAVFSTISGGEGNRIFFYPLNVIGGGSGNENSGSVSTISGGQNNKIGFDDPNQTAPDAATVSGGRDNLATGSFSSVGGGEDNESAGSYSVVGGGLSNLAGANSSTVAGGSGNRAAGPSSTIVGGTVNAAAGAHSTVVGGFGNCAGGAWSWAGGRRGKVRPSVAPSEFNACVGLTYPGDNGDQGTFIWADSQDANFISSGPNQFLIRAQGGVGIGTNAPQNQLHVIDSISASASAQNHVAQIQNTSTAPGADVLALRVGATGNLPNTISFITFIKGDNTAAGFISGNGTGGIAFNSQGADYAEWLPFRDPERPVQPGDIVGWTSEGIGHSTADALRIMVISTSPIVVGNAPLDGDESAGAVAAFVGQVPVRVRGPVRAGDFIVPSGLDDGTAVAVSPEAMHTSQIGRIAGRALESGEGDDVHRINALVGLPHEGLLQAQLARLEQENATLREQMVQERAETEARLARLESLLGE